MSKRKTEVEQSQIRCKKCGYDLRGLQEHRCPECGTGFSPGDSKTFLTQPVSGMKYAIRVVVGCTLCSIPFLVSYLDLYAIFEALPFLVIFAPLMIVGGMTLGGVASFTSYLALTDRMPWTIHRAGFWFAIIVGGILYFGMLGRMFYALLIL